MKLTFSIIVPMYNSAQYVERAVASAVQQEGVTVEVLLVDDGSTDGTLELAKKFAQSDTRIRVFHQENGGQASARNLGASMAEGDYLAFLDADDTWAPSKLRRQYEECQREPDAILAFANARIIRDGREGKTLFDILPPQRGRVFPQLIFGNFIPTSSVIVEKQAFYKVGGFRVGSHFRYVEDYDLWLRLSLEGSFVYLPDPLVGYTRHATNASKAKVRTAWNAARLIAATFFHANLPVSFGKKCLALARHCLVLVMYTTRLDVFLSPLR